MSEFWVSVRVKGVRVLFVLRANEIENGSVEVS